MEIKKIMSGESPIISPLIESYPWYIPKTHAWLVVLTILKNMSSSMGGKQKMFETTNQIKVGYIPKKTKP